ncbi:Hsp20/alpha crystallin family protein [Algoriphagus sp. CAU 1675]|uniref:Hsp20/alpha crystallin family protein n=1 Tax=Algoriphagus sp. CAU 1675 TaxID=3032597 RepID=UPI0023D9BEC7|nr:Hsp20/alpha crystallin family protein [Algoriphagus sp. CAU 1675]MDF2159250.1 Hsp20/alpha crystallin family protein [Algoriphagus sp. CAU 1675]
MKLTRFNQLDPVFPSGFNGILNKFINESFNDVSRRFSPAVDISEDEKAFEIEVALPGMKKNDFNVDLTDGRLTISGERKFEEKKEGKNYHSMETQFGSFSRSFYVPDNILVEKVEAFYEDGVLKVTLPKAEQKVTKAKIEVK